MKKNNFKGESTTNPRDANINSPFPNVAHHLYENKRQRIDNNTQKNFKVSNSSCPFPKHLKRGMPINLIICTEIKGRVSTFFNSSCHAFLI